MMMMVAAMFGDGAFRPGYKRGAQNVLPASQHQIVRPLRALLSKAQFRDHSVIVRVRIYI